MSDRLNDFLNIAKSNEFKARVFKYLEKLNTGLPGDYRSCINGQRTLYASCFALMIYHYLGELKSFGPQHLESWGRYIIGFQEEEGYFAGPEITQGKLTSRLHPEQHLKEHSTAHVLPALKILGISPKYPLKFAYKYIDEKYLRSWLKKRDWKNAWLEGNNLLFVGQFLTFLYEDANEKRAIKSIEILLDWLDKEVDPNTGLWGSNGFCDHYEAVYGGYHQLLLYYYWERNIKHHQRLVDTVLSLQHVDGGFSNSWGGGTCQDVDAVDILVNMYKKFPYRRDDIITALRRNFISVMERLTSEGGFADSLDRDFRHMGMEYTYTPKNKANIFSTWFGVHTLLLISEILELPSTKGIDYQFNPSCSMGWHLKNKFVRAPFWGDDWIKVLSLAVLGNIYFLLRKTKEKSPFLSKGYKKLKRFL